MKIYRLAQVYEEDYVGQHSAPDRSSGSPMHDLSSMYPDDIYSHDAVRLYNSGESSDAQCIGIIQGAKGRPRQRITVYRAVPDYNYDIDKEIRKLYQLISYHNQYNFFPVGNEIAHQLDEKYPYDQHENNERSELIKADILNQAQELESQKQPKIRINAGDWVTISRDYAKGHGISNLNGKYKILQKTAQASQLFTDGNSIQEWGYNP